MRYEDYVKLYGQLRELHKDMIESGVSEDEEVMVTLRDQIKFTQVQIEEYDVTHIEVGENIFEIDVENGLIDFKQSMENLSFEEAEAICKAMRKLEEER